MDNTLLPEQKKKKYLFFFSFSFFGLGSRVLSMGPFSMEQLLDNECTLNTKSLNEWGYSLVTVGAVKQSSCSITENSITEQEMSLFNE